MELLTLQASFSGRGQSHHAAVCSTSAARAAPRAKAPQQRQRARAVEQLVQPQSSSSSIVGSSGLRSQPKCHGSKPLKVAVDVDEVLGRFVHSLNKFLADSYGLHHEVSDYWVYEFARIWGCSPDESNHRVHAFFGSHHFAEGIEPIPGARESLGRLRSQVDLCVVTSRQHVIQEPTLEWIAAHFPGIFDEVHFGNHFALEGASRRKSEICAAVGAQVLVDDNPTYALECAQAGIHVLLYDWEHGYPWSKTADGPSHELITRVRDWAEAERVLGVLAARHAQAQQISAKH